MALFLGLDPPALESISAMQAINTTIDAAMLPMTAPSPLMLVWNVDVSIPIAMAHPYTVAQAAKYPLLVCGLR